MSPAKREFEKTRRMKVIMRSFPMDLKMVQCLRAKDKLSLAIDKLRILAEDEENFGLVPGELNGKLAKDYLKTEEFCDLKYQINVLNKRVRQIEDIANE